MPVHSSLHQEISWLGCCAVGRLMNFHPIQLVFLTVSSNRFQENPSLRCFDSRVWRALTNSAKASLACSWTKEHRKPSQCGRSPRASIIMEDATSEIFRQPSTSCLSVTMTDMRSEGQSRKPVSLAINLASLHRNVFCVDHTSYSRVHVERTSQANTSHVHVLQLQTTHSSHTNRTP